MFRAWLYVYAQVPISIEPLVNILYHCSFSTRLAIERHSQLLPRRRVRTRMGIMILLKRMMRMTFVEDNDDFDCSDGH